MLLAMLPIGLMSQQATLAERPDAPNRVVLLGQRDDRLDAWQGDTGAWVVVGEATPNPVDAKLLVSTPGNGVAVNGPTGNTVNIESKAKHGDVFAHIEFMVPEGSNSGVYFQGRYEIQVFDSWGVRAPQYSDCGGVYRRWDEVRQCRYEGHAPRVNVSRKPGEWQTFEVVFRSPRFDSQGKKIANARFERVIHNGVVIHENVEVSGPTRAADYDDEQPTGPLMLQGDHGPVAFRNIWFIPLGTEPTSSVSRHAYSTDVGRPACLRRCIRFGSRRRQRGGYTCRTRFQ